MFALAVRGLTVIEQSLVRNPGLVAKIASKLNLKAAQASVTGIIAAVKNNPILSAMTLWQIGDAGRAMLTLLSDEQPELKEQLKLFTPVTNPANLKESESDQLDDELVDLQFAISRFGGLESFLQIRRALSFDEPIIASYLKTRERARKMGLA